MNYRLLVLLALAFGCRTREAAEYPGFVDEPVAPVAAQASGRVVAMHVREGDRVAKGELLAELDSGEAKALVDQAQANLDRAQSSLAQARANYHVAVPAVTGAGAEVARAEAAARLAKDDYDRAARLFDTKAISQAELDKARAEFEEAEATVASLAAGKTQAVHRVPAASAVVGDAEAAVAAAKAALDLAQVRLEYTRITAPFDGMVVSRDLEEGQWAAPGTPVVTVEETARTWVRLDVAETAFGRIRVGAPANIRVVALGNETFRGHVEQIGAEGDFALDQDVKRGRPDVRTFMVRVAFDSPPETLRPGMTADVTITGAPPPPPRVAVRP